MAILPEAPSLGFFLTGIGALLALFLVTLLMDTAPEVIALRGLILVGLALVTLKTVLRYRGIDWPRRR